jgi:ABC-type amino acid transport substrate-binding protein
VSGVFVDLLRQIGTDTGLKVEYTEEVGWGTMIEGLNASRYDVIGSPVWANPARGARATLSSAVYFTPIGVWVRSDDTRFASATAIPSINAPDIRIAAMDGSTPELIARTQFPAAKLIGYPDITGEPQLFLDVVQKKADVFFAEPALGAQFLRSHPGSLRDIAAAAPIRSFANVYMMRANEPALKMLIDTALQDLDSRGVIDALLQKYEPVSGAFLRRAVPYRTANGK